MDQAASEFTDLRARMSSLERREDGSLKLPVTG